MWSSCGYSHPVLRDVTGQGSRGKLGAGNKIHQWTKALGGRGPDEMQSGDRTLQPGGHDGIPVDLIYLGEKRGRKEAVARKIDTIASTQQHMVDYPFRAIVQAQVCLAANFPRRDDAAAGGVLNLLESGH